MHKYLLFFLGLYSVFCFGQKRDSLVLKGKINAYITNLEGVSVINKRTEQAVFTNQMGDFSINAQEGDTLVFSGLQFKRKEVVLCEDDFGDKILNIHLVAVARELNEVTIINYSNINAVSLGIISPNQKKYTPAERKYASASSFRQNPLGLDPIINLISGRSAMLKKGIAIEKKETYMGTLEKMFTDEYFVNKLGLPSEYIKGFEYYVVDNQKFTRVLDTKNRTSIEFLLAELAEKYKSIIAVEDIK